MTDFLLELLSEEIPARMQDGARAELSRLFTAELSKAGLTAGSIETYATPRRLTLIARGLPERTEAVSEELKGPRANAPPRALEGFLRKTGLTREQLVERDGVLFAVIEREGRATADVLAQAIPAIVRQFAWPKSMRWGAASHSTESLRWVRPLHGIVALFGGEIVGCDVDGIASGAETVGHRFHHPGRITIGGADDYAAKLEMCHVIVDQEARKALIRDGARALAANAGLTLIEDEGLVSENAGLTEWPVPLLGGFDPAFLEVPPEVIALTMRTNQKYFALTPLPRAGEGDLPTASGVRESGELAPNFIAVANLDARDNGHQIAEGNAKVLAARLADARFFWEQDLRVPLERHAEKLKDIVFHEKLGTVADKVERVAKLARWLVEEGIVGKQPLPFRGGAGGGGERPLAQENLTRADSPHPNPSPEGEGLKALADMAEQAARLCKADLTTQMVGEFPELQGVIGGYYAAKQGLDPQIAAAIRDHYKPVGQGDEVPTDPVTVAVSLADKLDTLGRFFAIEEYPSGSKDPFALRRAALGVLRLIRASSLDFEVGRATTTALFGGGYQIDEEDASSKTWRRIYMLDRFFKERLRQLLRDEGKRHDLVSAVLSEGNVGFNVSSAIAASSALESLLASKDGANLLAGYKRAANILKKENWDQPNPVHPERSRRTRSSEAENPSASAEESDLGSARPTPSTSLEKTVEGMSFGKKPLSYTPLDEEQKLIDALDSAEPAAARAIEAEDFAGAMRALASLRAPIDAFFDKVTVNDPDPAKREARLALLARVRDAVHRVADFSKIEG